MARVPLHRRYGPAVVFAVGSVALVASCNNQPNMPPGEAVDVELDTAETSSDGVSDPSAVGPSTVSVDADLVIRGDLPSRPIDRRVFGTNLPAWIGAERLADPAFRQAAVDAGVTVVRMPGGSWSNAYDWRACEDGPEDACFFDGVARPRDFIGFLDATGLEGMWTVSINQTAQSAAAAVAFFNGDVDDTRPIGVDRNGEDWGLVGQWALVRASRGFVEPVGIQLWEVGNEVYGGTPAAGGDECADFGWEDVWTCDGAEYVSGDDEHDGYLAIREAMVAVDPSIEVGAVGVSDPSSWSDWGNEVIAGAGAALDFYVVHEYGFDASPEPDDAVERPGQLWPRVVDNVRDELGEEVPIAITEYNMVSFEAGDTRQTMTLAMNALYTADSLGQFVDAEIPIANHWNLANGVTGSGTDYGLVHAETGDPYPAFEAFRLWAATGDELLEVESDLSGDVRVYATRHADGSLDVVLLNLTDVAVALDVVITGLDRPVEARHHGWLAPALDADELAVVDESRLMIDPAAPQSVELPAWSMTLLEVD